MTDHVTIWTHYILPQEKEGKILEKSKSVIPGRRDVPETPDMILTLPIVGLGVSKITGERLT